MALIGEPRKNLDPKLDPSRYLALPRKRREPRVTRAFVTSGRQDLNLRPPGPQPGALPDCATPRGYVVDPAQAGDGNRTRPKSLEGSCATTTLRPRADSGQHHIGVGSEWR